MNNHLKLVIRALIRQKKFLIFSVVSLSLCISLVILTSGYYSFEISSDKHQSKYDRIYRLVNTPKDQVRLDEKYYNTLSTDVSGIDKVCRVNIFGSMITSNDIVLRINNLVIADSSYFDIFDHTVVMGSKPHLLDAPNKIVLSKSLAGTLFGNENPLGKPVKINMITTAYVSGVIEDRKEKSHFNSDAIVSLSTENLPWTGGNFGNQNGTWKVKLFSYYLLLNEKADVASVTAQIKETYNFPWYSFTPNIEMQPLSDIFTNNDFRDEHINHLNKPLTWLLFLITLIVIIIAGINYINLSLSNLNKESKMVSILKVNGAHRNNMFWYYTMSGGLVILLSFCISIALSIILLPYFNRLTGAEIQLNILTNFAYLIPFSGIIVVLFIIIILYPAWLFSGTNPVNLFQKKLAGQIRLSSFSRILLIFQFTAAIALIASVLMIFKQINYVKNKNPGFETSYLIKQNIHFSVKNTQTIKTYADELLKNAGILKLALSEGVPLGIHSFSNQEINGRDVKYNHIDCDTAFFNVLDMKLVAGRTFFDSDKNVCIVTEKLAKQSGFREPLNEKMGDSQIIGIIKDFNSMSMHQEIDGVMFRPLSNYISNVTIRINGTNIPQTISDIQQSWKKFFPEYPFNYQFYDDLIAQQYTKEQKLADSISIIAGLAMFLCCLGLLGLVLNMVENRIKEIGIRKVNGAKISEILAMLNKDFVKWVGIAFVLATPISWVAMNKWLENFAYKTNLSWWIFAMAGVLALGIALLTVSWQSWKAATRNPVEALRYE
ncbi:ABC transporter permease [Maribellus maritimus]|uniref:ABC transporter permease n=1 Tax=Maribellus maritimus TaxID=2870838 RepID=UPI001EEA94BD|nr:ABC transporter permease [Maribellus maritimus]MCG6189792.1 ABC transporter permease [Maribellus maritimus]